MPNYKRLRLTGGTYFFTAGLEDRRSTLLVDRIDDFREAWRYAKQRPVHDIGLCGVAGSSALHLALAERRR
jgi:putative transposase